MASEGAGGAPALFSVRMRAAAGGPHERGGWHVSGAERILCADELPRAVSDLVRRARGHALGSADFIQVTVERLPASVPVIPGLPVTTLAAAETGEARRVAAELLAIAGVDEGVARAAIGLLAAGPGPGGSLMRGAVVMDAATGRRQEPDPARGVRVSTVDLAPGVHRRVRERLRRAGLPSHRVLEAAVLASKGAWAGTLAELCWSDDPGYTTGYVAAPRLGYVRIPYLKPAGVPVGGRVFFVVGGTDLDAYVRRLEDEPALVADLGPVSPPVPPTRFLEEIRLGLAPTS